MDMKNGFLTYLVAKNRRNKLKWRVPSAMLTGLALLFAFQGFSRADDNHEAKAITDCSKVIDRAGRYFLAKDLKMCQDFGVSITVSNVELELRDHTIQGPSNQGGLINVGGNTGVSNIQIVGPGTLTGGSVGIFFQNVQCSQVNNLVVVGNTLGIVVTGTSGGGGNICEAVVGPGDLVSVPTMTGTTSTDNEFRDNVVAGQIMDGVDVTVPHNRFIHNNLSRNGGHGLLLTADNNIVSHNTVDSNGTIGIDVFGFGSIIDDNTALGNAIDLQDENNGICTANTWTDNSFNSPFGCNVSDR
jgi:hypothetical protein